MKNKLQHDKSYQMFFFFFHLSQLCSSLLICCKKEEKKLGGLEAKCYISQFFHALIFTTKPNMF